MIEHPMRPAFTMQQAAEILGVAQITVRRRVRRGEIASFRVGRSVRILAREIDRITTARNVGTAA